MRPVPLPPPGVPGPPRPRIGATVPLRMLGLFLLTLAITVPGCQALLYAGTSASVRAVAPAEAPAAAASPARRPALLELPGR